MKAQVAEFVEQRWGVPRAEVKLHVRSLSGGLESAVAQATIGVGRGPTGVPRHLVVKELQGTRRRESAVYRSLWDGPGHPPAARLLGVAAAGDAHYLFLEYVEPPSEWPWRDTFIAEAVCKALARLHDDPPSLSTALDWDYESELAGSAHTTLATAHSARDAHGVRLWHRLGDLKRTVDSLPAIRARLLESERTTIHGDLHPGNVILRPGGGEPRVALIDWGRARTGSPLEDIASWLHSLGCWEPEARRRHDTLLRAYLESRRIRWRLTDAVREPYWLACASNGLSGAIRYHLAVLSNPHSGGHARWHSALALREWERVVRRAATILSTSRAG